MRRLAILPLLLWAGCTCSPEPTTPSAAPGGEDEVGTPSKGKKPKKPKKGKEAGATVKREALLLKQAEFVIPLTGVDEAALARIRDAMHAAAQAADPNGGTPTNDELQPWKCREAEVFPLKDRPGETVTVFQRYATPACEGDADKWWVENERRSSSRPTDKEPTGQFVFRIAGEERRWSGGAWDVGYTTLLDVDPGNDSGAWPHDAPWLGTQLPDGQALGKPTQARSERWQVGRVEVANEKLYVEVDAWTCAGKKKGKDKSVGTVLRFRTNRRAAGHTPQEPKDVVVIDRVQAFADTLVKDLGDLVGGELVSPAAVLACGK